METISFDDFKKVELRTGKILSAEAMEGSEKLVRLKVDLGTETRQILAGIRTAYAPEVLVGKNVVVVANLAPRKMMGELSEGMLLAASDETPVLLAPEREVPPGSEVR
jgi:methionine--tRNA ligase beta chain